MRRHGDTLLLAAALAAVLASITVIVLVIPPGQEKAGGIVQKIFYFHVSSAWLAFLSFLMAMVCGIGYLRSRGPRWDMAGHAAVEVGMLFCTLVVLTGPIWAKPVWGRYWSTEPRLVSFTIMWFTYAGLLVLRGALAGSDRQAAISAAYAVVASVNVPLVYFSVKMVRENQQAHPQKIELSRNMRLTFLLTLVAFTLLWIALTRMRYRLACLEHRTEQRRLQEAMGA